jgi:hypothetical protein
MSKKQLTSRVRSHASVCSAGIVFLRRGDSFQGRGTISIRLHHEDEAPCRGVRDPCAPERFRTCRSFSGGEGGEGLKVDMLGVPGSELGTSGTEAAWDIGDAFGLGESLRRLDVVCPRARNGNGNTGVVGSERDGSAVFLGKGKDWRPGMGIGDVEGVWSLSFGVDGAENDEEDVVAMAGKEPAGTAPAQLCPCVVMADNTAGPVVAVSHGNEPTHRQGNLSHDRRGHRDDHKYPLYVLRLMKTLASLIRFSAST